jgi:hypothetical protein
LHQTGHQGGEPRLPARRLALLPQQDQAPVRVEVGRAQGQRAAAAAPGLGDLQDDNQVWERDELRLVVDFENIGAAEPEYERRGFPSLG